MKKNVAFMSLAMMAMMTEASVIYSRENPRDYEPRKEPKKIIPNGCKEYHFRKSGLFDTTENKWSDIEYIFTCVASNSKNAIKKFNAFMRSNQAG
jgi:hypothetical protein